jgi:hypothetical protein
MSSAPTHAPVVRSRHSAVRLLVALTLLFALTPILEDLSHGDLIESVALTIVMLTAAHMVSERRTTLVVALLLLVPALGGKWLNHFRPDLLPPVFFLVFAVAFFGFVVAHLLRFIVRSPRVDANVLCAGVSGFLLLGLLWAMIHLLVARLHPGAFLVEGNPATPLDGFNAFYFSFVTLCTIGYGDVTPVSKAAKTFAVIEGIMGLFYMAVLISRLVSIHSSGGSVGEKGP